MTSRSVAYETARLRLSRYRIQGREGRLRAAMYATQVSAEALATDRAGVWLFAARKAELSCFAEYESASQSHGVSDGVDMARCPAYVAALEARRVLVVDDVLQHPATRELAQFYLVPRGVGAVLDAPILREGGRVIGAVRHEHFGGARKWNQRDVDFASSVADMVAMMFEQSERLELEAALHEQAEQRQESQKMEALGRMASAIVHDFNNVLGSIALATDLAVSEKTDMPSLAVRLTQIVDTAQRLNDQLLSFARGRHDPSGVCELDEVIEAAMVMLRAAVGARATLSYQQLAAAASVPIGRSQVEQLLLNLVLNSRDAIAARGMIQIAVRDAVPADDAPPQSIVLSVSDNGAGMDESTRSRVLEPYFTTKARGTGLGLSTVFAIVSRAGGSIRVESEPSAGTTVTLVLPRHHPG